MEASFRAYRFIAAAIAACMLFVACENDPKDVDSIFEKKAGIEEANQITSYLSENAKIKAKLTSPYMRRYLASKATDTPYYEFPRTLHVDFYDDSAQVETKLDARYAKYNENTRIVHMRDSVVVINMQKGDTLRTSELWWDQNKQEFYTDKPVKILQRDKKTFGQYGIRAAQDLSWWWVYSSSGQYLVPPEGLPQ